MNLVDEINEFISRYDSCAINDVPIDFAALLAKENPFIVPELKRKQKAYCSLRFNHGKFAGWTTQFYGRRGLDFGGLNLSFDVVIDFNTLWDKIQNDAHSNELCECDLQEVL